MVFLLFEEDSMKAQKHTNKLVFLSALVVLSVSLACGFSTSESDQIDVQRTLDSMKMTQAVLESQSTQEPTLPPGEETQPPSIEAPDVIYEGISFSFDPGVATSVNSSTVQGQNLGDDFMAGETYPTHYRFVFNGYPTGETFHNPEILVYPVAEYRAISQNAADQIDKLQSILVSRPGGSSTSDLPFLPLWNAAQVFSAQVSYFDFQNGSGVRFLTMYAQALYPVDNRNLFYTYQGITSDGQYYLSAILPITHPVLPDDGDSQIDDYETFANNWEFYLADTLRLLGEQPTETYFPSMLSLDEMMASFRIDR